MTLCVDCEYPLAGDVSSVRELPRSWRPPYGRWIPNGPRIHFRTCEACDSLWAVIVSAETGVLDVRLLAPEAHALFEEGTELEAFLDFFVDESDGLLRSAYSELLSARLEDGEPSEDIVPVLNWLTEETRPLRALRDALPLFGQLLTRVTADPHLERARSERPGKKRELFGARIDQGYGLAEAARLAQRDWVSTNKVVSLPTVRSLDLTGLVMLHERTADEPLLHDQLGRTLAVLAAAALRQPARLTVTPESERALAPYVSD